jgi:hypothetical protein
MPSSPLLNLMVEQVTLMNKTYKDTNSDLDPAWITAIVTVNSKAPHW